MSDAASATAPESAIKAHRWLGLNFASAVLLSAFLLFQVQPLISKFILPWFGGSPAVWSACMLFFQLALCGGYAYAHFSQRALSPRLQGVVHAALLIAAVLLLPIAPDAAWKPLDSEQPVTRILALLATCVGLPYFALSATGPLLQAWFARACPGRSPYRLYSLSNLGSLAALLTYPVLFEPALDLTQQARLWSAAFVAFAVLCAAAAYWAARASKAPSAAESIEAGEVGGLLPANVAIATLDSVLDIAPSGARRAQWLLAPACASLLLLATTNHICEDVPPMPFLWVVPLSLYLLTFIISFDHERWYSPKLFSLLAAVAMFVAAGAWQFETTLNYVAELALYFSAMFLACMVCHGELVRSRPNPKHLTEFYMLISAGGALGGVFVSLVAPHVFDTYFEWPLAIIVSYLLAVVVAGRAFSESPDRRPEARRRGRGRILTAIGLAGLCPLVMWQVLPLFENPPLARLRNFYGVVAVEDRELSAAATRRFYAAQAEATSAAASDEPTAPGEAAAPSFEREESSLAGSPPGERPPELRYRQLRHGRIIHGRQFLDPLLSRQPTAYYTRDTGLGQAIAYFQDRDDLRIGVVGLGAGTIAAYGRPGTRLRFYEINPQVLGLANEFFTYLSNCEGAHEVVLGDARLSLEQEKPQGFHVLVLDAFSGDSIPTHLLTREAFEIYMKHLAPDGVLAIHITNRYIDLAPVVATLADHFKLGSTRTITDEDPDRLIFCTDWVTLSRNQSFLAAHPSDDPSDLAAPRRLRMWTDHYSNLFEILK